MPAAKPSRRAVLGGFAEEFRIWCFGYDPATQRTEWAYAAAMLGQFSVLGGVVALLWRAPLMEVARARPLQLLPWAGLGFLLVAATVGGFALVGLRGSTEELPFPAERLRTTHTPPRFSLINQDGQEVSLSSLKGRVVVLTGVYARCAFTCPMILGQAKRAAAALSESERKNLTVLAITMDPENDRPEQLHRMADGQGVAAPLFQLLTGEPTQVESVLDALQIARTRDPVTGVIDHANLFLVIDKQGRIAYRLSLGERQERWLTTALGLLIRE